ncbi:glutamine--tRNA ligase [Desulfuribacillus stibiiarsenatis]|uniref:Glutamine--tRNA ligase n=1 Tax=Desulfuribacillus stibiiarsenatis TaxID=1390249 RepID=A0A1E5L5F1_9FIRM|nr:glutamine--tRNA ligase/YqeY domain fusion protein [Desulfuribacillus stibiiarsenatis]OEH85294.1 glutamine--tRNA ligase [Desulfuribacillus stibiiarsenatis]
MSLNNTEIPVNFIQNIITEDLKAAKNNSRVHTRFPPEPNGYLHIGHAKSICLNFGLANANGGLCNLRMDDTNPSKEEEEFVESIKTDVKWLGYDWEDRMYFASDYFEKLYQYAVQLIQAGKAYVCDLSAEQMREYRGTLTEPGKNSPYRDRSVEENLDLFNRMRAGEFASGTKVLRAKIDMTSGNLNMRDPVIYRIMFAHHHRTGDAWCIYPMYDFAHPLSDAIENITHSICTLEFADHRPLYDWLVENVDYSDMADGRPHQYEFARLNLSYTVMSKRKLKLLVEENHVTGWDDPRMPTISGLRRRGYTPESIRDFCERIGVAKASSLVDKALLEHCIREDLNARATRAMAVVKPLKLVLENYPEDQVEFLPIENNPEQEGSGMRNVPFSREIYIEQDDFMEDPPNKFFRLAPGKEVRLKGAYIIKCEEVIKDENGNITELRCTYDPETRSGLPGSARKVKGVLHWVSVLHGIQAEVRLYEDLFTKEQPDMEEEGSDFRANINPDSLAIIQSCIVEPILATATKDDRFQFMRQGYFCIDSVDSKPHQLVFNRIVSLKDSYVKVK